MSKPVFLTSEERHLLIDMLEVAEGEITAVVKAHHTMHKVNLNDRASCRDFAVTTRLYDKLRGSAALRKKIGAI